MYDGRRDHMKATRIPTSFQVFKHVASRPDTCKIINLPRAEPLRPSFYGRHIPTSESVKRYRESLSLAKERASTAPWLMHRRTLPGQGPSQREATSAYSNVKPLFIRRPQSELAGYHKTFPYVNSHCYFQPAKESARKYFVVDRNWMSEKQQFTIKKNNVFA